MQRWRMEEEDDNRHVIDCNSRPLPLPCTCCIINQPPSWFCSIYGRMYDLHCFLIRDDVPYLIEIDETFDTISRNTTITLCTCAFSLIRTFSTWRKSVILSWNKKWRDLPHQLQEQQISLCWLQFFVLHPAEKWVQNT